MATGEYGHHVTADVILDNQVHAHLIFLWETFGQAMVYATSQCYTCNVGKYVILHGFIQTDLSYVLLVQRIDFVFVKYSQ